MTSQELRANWYTLPVIYAIYKSVNLPTLVNLSSSSIVTTLVIIINFTFVWGWAVNRAVRRTLRPPHHLHHCPQAAGVLYQKRVQMLLKAALSTITRTMATQRRPQWSLMAPMLRGRTCELWPVHLHILPFPIFHPSSTTTSHLASSGQSFYLYHLLHAFLLLFASLFAFGPKR